LASASRKSKRSRSAIGAARRETLARTRRNRPYPRPRKRFGQHFLEPAWVDKLLQVLAPSSGDAFLEIGPGRGALTTALAQRVKRIVAVEIDRDLAAALPGTVPANVDVVTADILLVDLDRLLRDQPKPLRVVGNLPYNISSPILLRLLREADEGKVFSDATLMLQKEVAERLVAVPGSSSHGTLALQAGLAADVEPLLTLPPGAFRPAPKVDSALVRLRFRQMSSGADRAAFERVVRGLFIHRRKTLLNALRPLASSLGRSAEEVICHAGLDPSQRPQTLTVADVVRLSRAVL
jgi:16S rRNA (adenine1518-N6/adenine1519-N6)-dimethyltransferase